MAIYGVEVYVRVPFEVEAEDQYQAEEIAIQLWDTYLDVADTEAVEVYNEEGELQ